MNDKTTVQKVADALFGAKKPPSIPQVNPNKVMDYKLSPREEDRRKNAINTTGVRG